MGTYTANYNLFMPSVGEQGWGDLVNGNFTTIDTAMSGLNTRVGALETNADAIEERVTKLESGNFETVTAESIYGNLYGKRIGELTLTQPYKWSNAIGSSYIKSNALTITDKPSSTRHTITIPMSNFLSMSGLDDVDNPSFECTYTLTAIPYNNESWSQPYYPKYVTMTITNLFDNNTTIHDFTLASVNEKPTFTAPAAISSIEFYLRPSANANIGNTYVAISRQNVYAKPKGT